MNRQEAIEQLEDLIRDRQEFLKYDDDDIFKRDIEALQYAVEKLKN